jgi:hypothetical protein
MRARRTRGAKTAPRTTSLFRGHRAGDTGELEPIRASIPEEVGFAIPSDPIQDPETIRYAPRAPGRYTWLSRLLAVAVVVGVAWMLAAAAWSWSQQQYFVGEEDGTVVIFRGIDGSLPGLDLSHTYERSNVTLDRLCDFDAGEVRDGISASSLADARDKVDNLATKMTDGGDC